MRQEIEQALLPELHFARQMWAIDPDVSHWRSAHGDRFVEVESDSISLLDALVQSNLCKSKGEARRLVRQGGVSVWFVRELNPDKVLHKVAQEAEHICLVQKGKHGNRLTADTAILYWENVCE